MEQKTPALWINEEEKIISFHKEENCVLKVFESSDDYMRFILVHGRCGYRFK
ncbi:MAG: hypothetical protein ACI4F7_04220 [Acutalibacteraceae bacterium]